MHRPNDRIENQDAAVLVAKGPHRMRSHLDPVEQPLNIVVGADRAPMLLGKIIEAQAIREVLEQTLPRVRDNGLPLGGKRFDLLLRLVPIGR